MEKNTTQREYRRPIAMGIARDANKMNQVLEQCRSDW